MKVKKLFAMLLALVMMLSLMPMTVLATDASASTDTYKLIWRQSTWQNDAIVEDPSYSYEQYHGDPYADTHAIFVYFTDGTNESLLSANNLYSSNTDVVALSVFADNPAAVSLDITGFGCADICYDYNGTTYTIPVTSELPTFGFYSAPQATQANFLENFTQTEASNTLYFVANDSHTMQNVSLAYAPEGSTITVNSDGTYATIVLSTEAYTRGFVTVSFDCVDPNGNVNSDWNSQVVLLRQLPTMFFYNAWINNGSFTIDDGYRVEEYSTSPSDGIVAPRLDIDGEVINVDPAALTSTDTNVVKVSVCAEDFSLAYLECVGFGEAAIAYTHTNGKTYMVPVTVALPDVGFYSKPEATEANYITSFTATESNDTLYLIAREGRTISNVRLNGFPEGSAVSLDSDSIVATITVGHSTVSRDVNVECDVTHADGSTYSRGMMLKLSAAFPGLYYRDPSWDENGNPYEDVNNDSISSFDTFPKKGTFAYFYFFDGTTETKLTIDQLKSSDETVMELTEERGAIIMSPGTFGTATIDYTHTDGKTYSIPVSVDLFRVDFYSESTPSKEAFVREFTVKDDNNTIYLAALDGWTLQKVEPGENWPDSDIVLAADGSYAAITIKGTWEEEMSSEVVYTVTNADGNEWSTFEYVELINGGNKMFFYWAMSDENGNMTPDESYCHTGWYTGPHGGSVFPKLQFNGEVIAIDPTLLKSGNTDIMQLTPDSETGTVYLDCVGFGETYISYTHTDGETYQVPVYAMLPNIGFYSKPAATTDSYLFDFTLTEDNDTVYLVAEDGFSFDNLVLTGFPEGTTVTYDDEANKTVATVTMGHEYAECWVEAIYTGITPEGEKYSKWSAGFELKSTFPNPDDVHEHNMTAVARKDATYTASGMMAHFKCDGCGKLFSDEAGTTEVTAEDLVIPQLVEVTEGTADVKEEAVEEAITNAGTSDVVTLPLTETKEEIAGAKLPAASLDKIAEADKTLVVETSYATVTIDTAALETITKAADDAAVAEITLEIKEIKSDKLNEKQQNAISDKKVTAVISAEIICGDRNVHDFAGGSVTVKLPFTPAAGTNGADYVIMYVDEHGKVERIRTGFENGHLIAVLPHFSEYVVVHNKSTTNPFIDVPAGKFYTDAVLWAVDNGITAGTTATTFEPDATCLREHVVTFLHRAEYTPAATGSNPFVDVMVGTYYYDAVLWAVENSITAGTTATTFSPDASCTRAQVVTFLWRLAGQPKVNADNPFVDVSDDAYYADAVKWAVANGITYGTSADTFSPDAPCTRGQVVTFLYRAAN